MQIRVVAVGKVKEKFIQDGIFEYEKRLRPYVKLHVAEVTEEKRPQSASPSVASLATDKEGERILAVLPEGYFVIALDINGEHWSSEELAVWFGEQELSRKNQLAFVIGGDLGLSPAVLARSNRRLSLSRMTFTHPIARLLLMEQLYRAFRILRKEPYHK